MNNSKTDKTRRCSAIMAVLSVPHTALYIITEQEMQRYQAWHKSCCVTYILNTCLTKRFESKGQSIPGLLVCKKRIKNEATECGRHNKRQ